MFNIEIDSTDKARSIVNNIGKSLVKTGVNPWVKENL